MSNLALTFGPDDYFNQRTPADGAEDKEFVKLFLTRIIENNKKRVLEWSSYVETALAEIRAECSVDGWDGEGGSAISQATLDLSRRVAYLLHASAPAGTPPPDVVPESDGELALSWTRTPEMVFSISIGERGYLNYAGTLAEGVEAHDVARFDPADKATMEKMAALLKQLYK
jgi:hypothetical protein